MMKKYFNLDSHDGTTAAKVPVAGKRIIYLYRIHKEAATEDATQIAFVSENELSISKDADSTATKSGSVRTPGVAEIEVTATSLLQKGDPYIKKLRTAFLNDELIEIWRANLDEPIAEKTNKFDGTYYQGYITEFSESSNAEDMAELSLTFGINGNGADGEVTVTDAQQEVAEYVFRDTPATGA